MDDKGGKGWVTRVRRGGQQGCEGVDDKGCKGVDDKGVKGWMTRV